MTSIVADIVCRTAELGQSIENAAYVEDSTHLFCDSNTLALNRPQDHEQGRLRDLAQQLRTDPPVVGHPSLLHVK